MVSEEPGFVKELEHLINKYSIENGSNTPDFILAIYIHKCLSAFNEAVCAREQWYGCKSIPGSPHLSCGEAARSNDSPVPPPLKPFKQ